MSDRALIQALLEMDSPSRWIARGFWFTMGILAANALPALALFLIWFVLAR